MAPPRPLPGLPPGAIPPPPPPAAPPPPPQIPPQGVGGLGAQSPLGADLVDLSHHMSPGWQQIDLASRCIKKAIIADDFQKKPNIVAVLNATLGTINQLLTAYNTGKPGGGTPDIASTSESLAGAGSTSSDADSQPAPEPTDEGEGSEGEGES